MSSILTSGQQNLKRIKDDFRIFPYIVEILKRFLNLLTLTGRIHFLFFLDITLFVLSFQSANEWITYAKLLILKTNIKIISIISRLNPHLLKFIYIVRHLQRLMTEPIVWLLKSHWLISHVTWISTRTSCLWLLYQLS